MSEVSPTLFLDAFEAIEDPRIDRTKLHPLSEIMTVAICAIICGADAWDDIEAFGNAKSAWLSTFLCLKHGIPCHDTFNRVFARINPEQFQACFLSWIQSVSRLTAGQVVAIDGKKLRGSYDLMEGKAAIHMVSAWASANRIVLGQVKVDEKSNEITAIPELLRVLAIAGCIVTIDAMGCQKEIASTIIDCDADYVLAVKENQPLLYADIERVFREKLQQDDGSVDLQSFRSEDQGHGRTEIRTTWTTDDLQSLQTRTEWEGLKSIGMVVAERTANGQTSIATRYYISSLVNDAQRMGQSARIHWSIENEVHWVLDVAFSEDASRICKDHSPHNMAILRHIALNLLKQEKTAKASIRTKRLKAGWNNDYLAKVLQVIEMNDNLAEVTN